VSELDLVPASWRERRRTRRALARFGFAYALALLIIVGVKLSLGMRIEVEAAELDRLQDDRHVVVTERARLEQMQQRQAEMTRALRTLEKLGGSADLGRVFTAVERTLGEEVWFREWVFMRAGEFVDVEPRAVETGYLILVPEQPAGERQRAWRLRTHMEIRGQALTHSSLADFVRRLSGQPAVREVTIVDTRSQRVDGTEVVDFELAVVMREPERGA